MAKYTEKKETFVFRKILDYLWNMVQNYDGQCENDDFFHVLNVKFDHDAAVELIRAAYTKEELEDMERARTRRGRLDLSDRLDEIFCALWNNKSGRGKCREIVHAAIDYMRCECPPSDDRTTEDRIACLRRTLKLTDLETDILTLTYVKADSFYEWPHRIAIRQVPKYYAMASHRKDALCYVHSLDEVYARFGSHIKMSGRYPANIACVMGDVYIYATFKTLEEAMEFDAFVRAKAD